MDISPDLEKLKRKSERGLEKPSQDKLDPNLGKDEFIDDDTIEVNGEIYKMPEDLKALPEIDYDDPQVQKWLKEQEEESIRRYGKLTSEEAEYMFSRRLVLEKEFPHRSIIDLNQVALSEFRTRKK